MKVTVRKFSGEDTASLVSLFHETVHVINIDKAQLNESIENYTEMIEKARVLKKIIESGIQK